MKNQLKSHLFTVLLLGGAIYCFYKRDFTGGILLAILGALRLPQAIFRKSGSEVALAERQSNVFLQVTYSIEKVTQHPSFNVLFEKIAQSLHGLSFEDWKTQIIESYKKKFKTEYASHTVTFNIKNSILWKNEKVDFLDSIHEQIFIPYLFVDGEEEQRISALADKIKTGVSFRIVVVNGFLELQMGDYSKGLTPKLYKDGFCAVYQRFETLSKFPLIYLGWRFGLPVRYLNLNFRYSNSYKDLSFYRKKRSELSSDWKTINRDAEAYQTLLASENSEGSDADGYLKIASSLQQKGAPFLKDEKFIDPSASLGDSYWPWEDGSVSLYNDYMRISLSDLNMRKEKHQELTFPDYWEERP